MFYWSTLLEKGCYHYTLPSVGNSWGVANTPQGVHYTRFLTVYLKRTHLKGVTCPQSRRRSLSLPGASHRIPSPGVQAVSKQCEEKEVFCHEDHDELQKAVSYCPQCPGAICEECVRFHNPKRLSRCSQPCHLIALCEKEA